MLWAYVPSIRRAVVDAQGESYAINREAARLADGLVEYDAPTTDQRDVRVPDVPTESDRRRERERTNAYYASPAQRGACDVCREPMGVGAVRDGSRRCRDCILRIAKERTQIVEARWAAGYLAREIAEELNTTVAAVNSILHRLRDQGRAQTRRKAA